jgi:hypothetical protein
MDLGLREEAKYHNRPDKTETLVEFMEKEKEKILKSCKKQLKDNGLIGVVSSRYAFRGAGYDYTQLSDEKLNFVDVYDRFRRLGAKKIYLVGVSQDGFDHMLAQSHDEDTSDHENFELPDEIISSVRGKLRAVSNLPDEDIYSLNGDDPVFQKAHIRRVKETTSEVPELSAIARIDAMFAEFA